MCIFDSGDTSHMNNNPNGLYNIEECLENVEYVNNGSGSIINIKYSLSIPYVIVYMICISKGYTTKSCQKIRLCM